MTAAAATSKAAQVATATKTCQGCGIVKPAKSFGYHPKARDRMLKKCDDCMAPIRAIAGNKRRATAAAARAAREADTAAIARVAAIPTWDDIAGSLRGLADSIDARAKLTTDALVGLREATAGVVEAAAKVAV